ncbi:MAG: pyridoxamine 5'-phosphate oxidase [Myxococcota bacterium]
MSFESAPEEPLALFQRWFDEAKATGVDQPETMGLATVDAQGRPSLRFVLLKGFDQEGFTFFTNYESRKAGDLDATQEAALAFYWHAQERQVRVEGSVRRASAEHSDAYFATRPRGSQLGAWASAQSRLRPEGELEARLRRVEAEFAGKVVPRPEHWGGYVLHPRRIEFWQGQPSRLHDRLEYLWMDRSWQRTSLYP